MARAGCQAESWDPQVFDWLNHSGQFYIKFSKYYKAFCLLSPQKNSSIWGQFVFEKDPQWRLESIHPNYTVAIR